MKKKLMMVAVLLGALTLGACVDDNESASVTKVREAKAKQLEAVAAWYNAQAEAEAVKAAAEAALNNAKAAYEQAQADATAAETDFNKQKYILELEKIKAEYEMDIALAKSQAALYEKQAWINADAHLQAVFEAYITALEDVNDLNENLINAKLDLAVVDVEASKAEALYNEEVIKQNQIIADNTAAIERLKALNVEDRDALYKQMQTLAAQAYNLENTDKPKANKIQAEAEKAYDEAYFPINYNYTSSDAHKIAAWEAALLPYVKAAKILVELETMIYPNVNFVETDQKKVEVEGCPSMEFVGVYTLAKNSEFINATQNITNWLEGEIKAKEANLGKVAAGTTAATGAYKTLADAEKNLKDLKEALAAEQAKTTPDESVIAAYQSQIQSQNIVVAEAEEGLTVAKEELVEAQAYLKDFNSALAAVKEGSDEQKAYVAAVENAIKAQEAVLIAQHKVHLVEDAIEVIGIDSWTYNDKTKPYSWSSNAEYGRIATLYDGTADVKSLIAVCETAIAKAKEVIEKGTTTTTGHWQSTTIEYYDPNFDNGDGTFGRIVQSHGNAWVTTTENAKPINVEDTKKLLQAKIDAIETELKVQETLVAKYKAELDALLAAAE